MSLWGKSPAKPLTTSTQKCPSGRHAMSVGWTKCPYCDAEQNAGGKTRMNSEADLPLDLGAQEGSAAGRPGPTRINRPDQPLNEPPHGEGDGGRRETRILSEAAEAGFAPTQMPGAAAHPASDGVRGHTRVLDPGGGAAQTPQRREQGSRRLTGIVVTYSWSALGRLFEVREGRNYGGSGGVAHEGNRDADILITDDGTLSSTHFLILCQGGKYRISDCNSTNGTFVEGQLIDALGIELWDGARIQAGATLLEFKKLAPVSAPPAVT